MKPLVRSELTSWLARLDECAFQANYHARKAVEWSEQAAVYGKAIRESIMSCDHCRAPDATHAMAGGDWWCDRCLANCCDM